MERRINGYVSCGHSMIERIVVPQEQSRVIRLATSLRRVRLRLLKENFTRVLFKNCTPGQDRERMSSTHQHVDLGV
jgi:hypothetical protein